MDLVGCWIAIAVSRHGSIVANVWVTDEPQGDLRCGLEDKGMEFRHWDGSAASLDSRLSLHAWEALHRLPAADPIQCRLSTQRTQAPESVGSRSGSDVRSVQESSADKTAMSGGPKYGNKH
jgi:hypothetical protein